MRYEAEIYYQGAREAIQPLMEAFLSMELKYGHLLKGTRALDLVQVLQQSANAALTVAEQRAQELWPEVHLESTPPAKPISATGGFHPGTET